MRSLFFFLSFVALISTGCKFKGKLIWKDTYDLHDPELNEKMHDIFNFTNEACVHPQDEFDLKELFNKTNELRLSFRKVIKNHAIYFTKYPFKFDLFYQLSQSKNKPLTELCCNLKIAIVKYFEREKYKNLYK